MFELNQLRQLLTIAEEGTLSAASEALNLSQPSLTRSMQKLEEELGVKLFDRKKNRIELNEGGRLAVARAKAVVDAAGRMENDMRDYARSLTTIAVGFCAPGPMWTLSPELIRQFPDRRIVTEAGTVDTLTEGLLNGKYRIVILDQPLEQEEVLCREYLTECLRLSVPTSHKLAQRDGIHLSDLAGQTMLLFSDLGVWERLHQDYMKDVRFIVQNEREAFTELVQVSAIPSFTTNLTDAMFPFPPGRVEIPILDPEAAITFYLCVRKKDKRLLESILPQE